MRFFRAIIGASGYALIAGAAGVVVYDTAVVPGALWARVVPLPPPGATAGSGAEHTVTGAANEIAEAVGRVAAGPFEWRTNRETVRRALSALDDLERAEAGFFRERDELAPRAAQSFAGELRGTAMQAVWQRLRAWPGVDRALVSRHRATFDVALESVDRAEREGVMGSDPRFDIRGQAELAAEVTAWAERELGAVRERRRELDQVRAAVFGG
jgi:hypothetical protein